MTDDEARIEAAMQQSREQRGPAAVKLSNGSEMRVDGAQVWRCICGNTRIAYRKPIACKCGFSRFVRLGERD